MGKKLTFEKFEQKAIDIHGNKYDYFIYNDSKIHIPIFCKVEEHGIFWQTPKSHLNDETGCPECGGTTKLTIEKFIERAEKIHIDENGNSKYDYFIYLGSEIDIPIFCHKEGHGIFWQTPHSHLKGNGCQKCGLDIHKQLCDENRYTTDEFIEKAQSLHINKETNLPKYDYSLVNYIDNKIKVKIICHEHGEFMQRPDAHLDKKGCNKCNPSHKPTIEEFIIKARKVFGDKYDYFVYNDDCRIKIPIFCRIHGIFWKTPEVHLNNKCGCNECQLIQNREKHLAEFKEKAILIHNNEYEYLSEYINNKTKMKMFCSKEGHGIFWQTPNNHIAGAGCPFCQESKGEKKIKKFLEENNITAFIRQYKFNDCRNINQLSFDFYLQDYNLCIEYDGELHYKSVEYFGGVKSLKKRKKLDKIKTDYCLNNNIPLLRIPYWDFKNIEEILEKELHLNLRK